MNYPQQQSTPASRDKTSLISRDEAGRLRMIRANNATVDKITAEPGYAQNLMRRVFSKQPLPERSEFDRRREFETVYQSTKCLCCGDAGIVSLPFETNYGQHRFAFSCVCSPLSPEFDSVAELVARGWAYLPCQIGGEGGSCCTFSQPQPKCRFCSCPKFTQKGEKQ